MIRSTIRQFLYLSVFTAAISLAPAALAGSVTYEIPTSGVVCAGTASHAETAVRASVDVKSVEADPVSHSVKATFDDDAVSLAAIVESLEDAGMAVGKPVQLQ